MQLNDIYIMAKAVEDILPEIAKANGGQNVRGDICINITLSERDMNSIDRQLYDESDGDYVYEKSDEVDIEVFGIRFVLTKKENA